MITPTRIARQVCIFAICASLSGTAAAAQNDDGAWLIFSTTDAFQTDAGASKWHYWFDAQARYFDIGSGSNQYLVRPAVGYELSENLMGWVGYARIRARGQSGNTVDENRYWQQLNWTAGQWQGGTFTMRTRLEQRSVSAGDDLGLVLRFMTKYVRPIGDKAGTNLVLGIEPFVDLKDTDWGGESGLGQNRTFIGVGWKATPKVSIETGYMNQYIWVDSGTDRMNHLGIVNFKVKF